MRTRILTKLATVTLLSLALACGADESDTNKTNPAQNLGDLGVSSKADEFEPVELNVDANSERIFEFASDSLALAFSFEQPHTIDPQPNRVLIEREDDGTTVYETETALDHRFEIGSDASQSESSDPDASSQAPVEYYRLIITNEGDEALQLMMTIQSLDEETSDIPDGCVDCGEGATCDITYGEESRTRVVCKADDAEPLTCAESISCQHQSWEDWRECTDACDDLEGWEAVSDCQSDCTDERLVDEAFCRDRNEDIESFYEDYDTCRTEFCDGFWAEFDGLQWEIDCMEENCADPTATCEQN